MLCKCGCGKYTKEEHNEYCRGHHPHSRINTAGENNGMWGKHPTKETKNKWKNRSVWNKGLTKETDERVAKYAISRKHPISCKCPCCKGERGELTKEEKNKCGQRSGEGRRGKHLSDTHIRNVLRAGCEHPNKFETNALHYINTIYNNKFTYTGDGSLIINHRSADAYSKELNTIALFHGVYWHLRKKGLDITEENKRVVEKVDSLPFTSAGYKVIFIWEDELYKLLEKKCQMTN
jgi:hypothetical protein